MHVQVILRNRYHICLDDVWHQTAINTYYHRSSRIDEDIHLIFFDITEDNLLGNRMMFDFDARGFISSSLTTLWWTHHVRRKNIWVMRAVQGDWTACLHVSYLGLSSQARSFLSVINLEPCALQSYNGDQCWHWRISFWLGIFFVGPQFCADQSSPIPWGVGWP